MNVSILLAHPAPGSFNHAIAAAAAETLRETGHAIRLHDLYAEGFDPLLTAGELARDAVLPLLIEEHCREIESAEGWVIVHPNYWSAPPAILRGWVDRVLRAGRAYRFVPDGRGGARSEGLLPVRVGVVFNTANTPQEKEVQLLGDPLETHWMKVVFGLCGVRRGYRRNFASVILSAPEERARWLEEVRATVREQFCE